jgi:hypothetical protein
VADADAVDDPGDPSSAAASVPGLVMSPAASSQPSGTMGAAPWCGRMRTRTGTFLATSALTDAAPD